MNAFALIAIGITLSASVPANANVTLSLSKGAPPSAAPTTSATTIPAIPFPVMPKMPAPFQLDRSHIGIVPGTTEKAHASGVAHRPVRVTSSFAGVIASYDSPSRTLSLKGVTRGSGTVTLIDAYGAKASADVFVAPAAGTVASDVSVELAGDVTPSFIVTRVRSAIAHRSVVQPFVDVRIPFSAIPLDAPQTYTLPVDVELDGKGTFVNVKATSNVHLRLDPPAPPLPPGTPQTLLYSDSPEYVIADGVLFRSQTPVTAARPARMYLYHVAMTDARTFALVLRAHDSAARVALTGSAAPTSSKYLCTGHRATADFLRERRRRESVVATVAPGRPFVLPLQGDMHVRDLMAAVYEIREPR